MTLDERLEQVAVLGAGGKMGSGITLLLAREMTLLKLRTGISPRLVAMDVRSEALEGLSQYLEGQARKFAQKNSSQLSQWLGTDQPDKLAERFAAELLSIVEPATDLQAVSPARMVLEAIVENVDLKVNVLSELRETCDPDTLFFSNTSSIPIGLLNERAGLEGRLVGFHFYNPPAVQKLVELIIPRQVHPELPDLCQALARRLGKTVIPSNDVAGFIGNGHFTRDGLHAIQEAERLQSTFSFVQSIYMINRVAQDFLIRPMGIFQLMDYVGLDVFQSILAIMNPHFPEENLHSPLIDRLVARGVKGGQYPDGSQKDGILKYEGGDVAGVYNVEKGEYQLFSEGAWRQEADSALGPLPKAHQPWKVLVRDPEKEKKLRQHFEQLRRMDTLGADLARRYLKRSRDIGLQLVKTGVARSAEDVNGVLMYGFYHLYGPINDFVE